MKINICSPQSEQELMSRAQNIAGLNLAQLAEMADVTLPPNLNREKGWVGQLIEWHLGAQAGSKPVPDFEHLGIELKTLPINQKAEPLETTYVCTVPLVNNSGTQWETSNIKHKLTKVLWIPILAERSIPLAERLVGSPILWQANEEEEKALKQDWEELMDMVVLGDIDKVCARHGEVLQIRPKAANASIRTQAIGTKGEPVKVLPRGFYLKKNFTLSIIRNAYY